MLYGISLIAGRFGTGYMPDLVLALKAQMEGGGVAGLDTVVILGMVLILVGLGFKLSAVPFHFWCPDVFEGAAAEVGAFLSVASKAAAMALTGRVLMVLAGLPDSTQIAQVARAFGPALAVFAGVTATFGNLAAYAQTNLKRLLAYSTIAHAGYMLMGLAPLSAEGVSAVLFYLVAYMFMNLGAFAIIAFLRNLTGSEDLNSFRGLVYRSPVLVTLLAVFLLSLLGLPPLVGFAAKFQIFQVLYDAGKSHVRGPNPVMGYTMYALLIVGGLNTVFSLFYYVKVLKVMILDRPLEEMENRPAEPLQLPAGSLVFGLVMSLLVLIGGIFWNPLATASDKGTKEFRIPPPAPPAPPGSGGAMTAPPPPPLIPPPGGAPKGNPKGNPK
jgi:NADH-quinone oxidoreductase subunit N